MFPKRFVKLLRPGLVGSHVHNAGDVVEVDHHRGQIMVDAKAAIPDVGPARNAEPDPSQPRRAERADMHARLERAEKAVGTSAK